MESRSHSPVETPTPNSVTHAEGEEGGSPGRQWQREEELAKQLMERAVLLLSQGERLSHPPGRLHPPLEAVGNNAFTATARPSRDKKPHQEGRIST